MLTDYIDSAMRKAHYEILPDGEGYYGSVDGLQSVWANADTLEDCRRELQEVLEEASYKYRAFEKFENPGEMMRAADYSDQWVASKEGIVPEVHRSPSMRSASLIDPF